MQERVGEDTIHFFSRFFTVEIPHVHVLMMSKDSKVLASQLPSASFPATPQAFMHMLCRLSPFGQNPRDTSLYIQTPKKPLATAMAFARHSSSRCFSSPFFESFLLVTAERRSKLPARQLAASAARDGSV